MSNLPFLRKKQTAGIAAEPQQVDMSPSDPTQEALEACASDLIHAIASQDAASVAEALRAAFEIMESAPHEEGEHMIEPNTNEEDR